MTPTPSCFYTHQTFQAIVSLESIRWGSAVTKALGGADRAQLLNQARPIEVGAGMLGFTENLC